VNESVTQPRVVLTFDDGPGPSTPALLDVLAARAVRATFFLLGRNIARMRELAIRAARDGHEIGNHTFSHARPGALTPAELTAEIARTDRLLEEIADEAGAPLAGPAPVRLPYGPDDARVAVLASLGRPHVHWTADFADWSASTDASALAARMRAHVAEQHAKREVAVLDLHDSSRLGDRRDATVAAVESLIDALGALVFSSRAG
jgi:chitin deacetylase